MISKSEFERLHPRGPDGKFIRKFGIVRWFELGVWKRGRAVEIRDDGSVRVRSFDGDEKIFADPSQNLYAVRKEKARLDVPESPVSAPEPAPAVSPMGKPGTSVGGVSTDVNSLVNVPDVGISPEQAKLLIRNMKSKGFTLTEERQVQLQEAKDQATIAISRQLGYEPAEAQSALIFLGEFLQRWQLTGGQSEQRRKMEAAWQKLRRGEPPSTDADRAAAIQKVYTDMTWDTRGMGEESIELIRGVSGAHASRIALADKLGEDWYAQTWPLTSWAIPGAETSVKNWVIDGIELKSDSTTRDEVFMMYHAEPLLREKGLKVKGEYVVDGEGALDSDEVKVERLFGNKPSNVFLGSNYSTIEKYIDEGRRFAEQTGGTSDDYVLGNIYDDMIDSAEGFGFRLKDSEPPYELWHVLGFEGPPASMATPRVDYDPWAMDNPDRKKLSYEERQARARDVNNPQRMAVAQDFRKRGHTATTVMEMIGDWHNYDTNRHQAERLRERLALPFDEKHYFDDKYGARDEEQATYWRDTLIPDYDARARYYAARLRSQRAALGLDDVFAPGLEPAPTPLTGHHDIPGIGDVDEYLNAHPPEEGEAVFEWQSRVVGELTEDQKHALLFESRERYEPVDYIAEGMKRWLAEHEQRAPNVDLSEIPVPLRKADVLARVYEETPDQSGDPRVQAAYAEFKRQTDAMWEFMTSAEKGGGLGITVEFWTNPDPAAFGTGPYPSAAAQAEDLRVNRHIFIEAGLGGAHEATMTQDEYDRFRAVHDVFGHAAIGSGFDRHGEYQAYLAHSLMYWADGRRAMASEYHGVNTALWAGEPGTPGTGKSILLPDELIPNPFDALDTGELITAAAGPQIPGPAQLKQLNVTPDTAEALAYLCVQAGIGPSFPALYDPSPLHSEYADEMERAA